MTIQVPPGPENAVSHQDYPQFTTGYAQYPPVQEHYVPSVPGAHAGDLSNGYSSDGYPGERYPVEGYPPVQDRYVPSVPGAHAGYADDGYPSDGYPVQGYPVEGHPSAAYPTTDHAAARPTATNAATAYPTADHDTAAYPKTTYLTATTPAATYPTIDHGAAAQSPAAYPAAAYPQKGAAGVPAPVPYPQPGTPSAHPPPTAYSTAPPWATVQPAPPAGPGFPPEPQHGGLLVAFPDEMQRAAKAQPPAVWPVAAFTLLFGVIGAVSANRRAGEARRTRNSAAPYWITFLLSAVTGAFLWFVVAVVVAGPVLTEIRETDRLEAVQRNVVGDGQLRNARINVTAAQCRAVTDRDAEGMRDYLCRLTLQDGKTASLTLTADESGQWRSKPGR